VALLKRGANFKRKFFRRRRQQQTRGRRVEPVQQPELTGSTFCRCRPRIHFAGLVVVRDEQRARFVASFVGMRQDASGFGKGDQAVGVTGDDLHVATER